MGYETINNLGITFGDGGENASGVAERAYFIPISWFAANGIKKPVAGVTAESLVRISVAHVLAAGKTPIPMTPLFTKSGLTWKLAGEDLSKIFEQGGEFFMPSNSAGNLGTAQAIKNYRGIVLVEKIDQSGHFWQIGSEAISAKVTAADGGTGVGPGGEVGIKVTFQSYSASPVFSYEAGIPAPAAP